MLVVEPQMDGMHVIGVYCVDENRNTPESVGEGLDFQPMQCGYTIGRSFSPARSVNAVHNFTDTWLALKLQHIWRRVPRRLVMNRNYHRLITSPD
jgi:hypothetical protein